jgi:hypothetical protein
MVARRRRPLRFILDQRADAILRADSGNADDDELSDEQLAEMLGVSVSWVVHTRTYRDDGPPVTMVGDRVKYRRRDVRRWLKHRAKQKKQQIADRERAQASKRASGGGRAAKEERKEKTASL